MKKINNKGMTLVEMILATLILAIVGLSLASCYTSVAAILNSATLFKNESTIGAGAIETQSTEEGAVLSGKTDRVTYKVNGNVIVAEGEYITYESEKCSLHYREFLVGTFDTFD